MRKATALLFLGFSLVYLGTWLVLGKRAMLADNSERIWTDWDLQTYAPDASLYLCTNLTEQASVTKHNRLAEVVSRADCDRVTVRDSLARVVYSVNPDSGSGMVLAYSVADVQTPLITRNGVGYWFYGSDHFKICDEWVTWMLFRWIVLYEANGPECSLSKDQAG